MAGYRALSYKYTFCIQSLECACSTLVLQSIFLLSMQSPACIRVDRLEPGKVGACLVLWGQ